MVKKTEFDKTINFALLLFSDKFNTSFSDCSFIPITLENAVTVCKKSIPKESYIPELSSVEHFETLEAEALPRRNKDYVLYRTDVDEDNWLHIFLHELAHIFLTHNEIDGGFFYNKYCMNNDNILLDGSINAGYAIWREFCAEYCACAADPFFRKYSINTNFLKHLESRFVAARMENKKIHIGLMLEHIFLSEEASHMSADKLVRLSGIPMLESLADTISEQLNNQNPFYRIKSGFIETLGNNYLGAAALRMTELLQTLGK